jgi:hypothetical protein
VLLASARQPRSAADTDLGPSASPALARQEEASATVDRYAPEPY